MRNVESFVSSNRHDFNKGELNENTIKTNPFELTKQWIEDAIAQHVNEPYAFTLATAINNKPTARILYLRGIKPDGYVFYTNYKGRKGIEIAQNNIVCMNFFWPELERQIRIEGIATKISTEDSDNYFNSRPRKSQLGAWASHQSEPLENHSTLDDRIKELDAKFSNQDVPRPEHWGGYIIKPTYFEFWQGRSSRLHDRIIFELTNQNWNIKRLNP